MVAIESVALLYGFISGTVVQLTATSPPRKPGGFIFLGLMVAMAALIGRQTVILGRARTGRTLMLLQTLVVAATLYFLLIHPNPWPELTFVLFATAGLVTVAIWDHKLRGRPSASSRRVEGPVEDHSQP
jgi:hypothetical protein